MCQIHTGAYVSLLAPGKTDYIACHPRKTTTYILHVVSITTHTHDRRKSIGKKKKEKEIKERKEKKTKNEKGRKQKERQAKQRLDKRKQGEMEKRKNVILADPRT